MNRIDRVVGFMIKYGWAILLAVLMIGIFSYLLSSPSHYPDFQALCEKNDLRFDSYGNICYLEKGDFIIEFEFVKVNKTIYLRQK